MEFDASGAGGRGNLGSASSCLGLEEDEVEVEVLTHGVGLSAPLAGAGRGVVLSFRFGEEVENWRAEAEYDTRESLEIAEGWLKLKLRWHRETDRELLSMVC